MVARIRNFVASLRRNKRKGIILLVGYSVNYAQIYFFNYLLDPFLVGVFGPINGGGMVIFVSFAVCYGDFLLYDYLKEDFLGFEEVKNKITETKNYDGKSRYMKAISGLLGKMNGKTSGKYADILISALISIKFDPFITTLAMRKEAYKFTKRDWKIFVVSLVVSNASWVALLFGGWSVFRYLGNLLGIPVGEYLLAIKNYILNLF